MRHAIEFAFCTDDDRYGATHKEAMMPDKDRVAGKGEQLKGKLKEGAGRATGNNELKAKGKADQVKGKGLDTYGRLKDKVKDATN
jgi:uncharacterized protein YjbJ (UPF0337 family)